MPQITMEKLVALAKGRGFIYPGSEIYGGLANAWDYGPLGVELKNNIKKAWWKKFVAQQPMNVGLDSSILMNPEVWTASGHLAGFSDPLMDCKSCKSRHRADDLIERFIQKKGWTQSIAGWDNARLEAYIASNHIPCPVCGKSDFTSIKQFNLMFKTFQGANEDTASTVYLRPETAQGIFVNFKNLLRTTRTKMPFGVGQIGKSFRNEITPGNFIYRIREFEQMELEFFCKPGEDMEWFRYWKQFIHDWLLALGMHPDHLSLRDHSAEELSHYSTATTDFEYDFPFGRGELWGVADRTDFDLMCHQKQSGISMEYTDPITTEKYVPYCIEPSVSVERLLLAFLCDAYLEESLEGGDTRTVLKLHPFLAPYKVAVLPLQKQLNAQAETIYKAMTDHFACTFDSSASIGKRYRRQDEIGTPFCVTVDFDTPQDETVTVRERDSMQQIRLPVSALKNYIEEKLQF